MLHEKHKVLNSGISTYADVMITRIVQSQPSVCSLYAYLSLLPGQMGQQLIPHHE